jgi:hypothetical protein
MTPTIFGRIQTRLFVVLLVGGFWTLLITPFLPVDGELVLASDGITLGDAYKLTFSAVAIVAIFGAFVWEPIYAFLMQFRWEKDWPAFFQFFQGIPEGISTWLLLHVDAFNPLPGNPVPGPAFVILFVTTWIVTWLAANGPMKILFLRWRFSGGRLF